MNNIIRCELHRMKSDKIFKAIIAVTLLLSVFVSLNNAPDYAEYAKAGDDVSLDMFYFNIAPLMGAFSAAFACLFIGTEHAEGTLRNKVISGYSRTQIFLSYFVVIFIGTLIINAVWLLGGTPGLLYFDGFEMGASGYAAYVFALILGGAVYVALYTTMSVLIPNKAVNSVICLVLWFLLFAAGSKLIGLLRKPEFIGGGYAYINGEFVYQDFKLNPHYIGGMKRKILTVICNMIPSCQAILISEAELEQPLFSTLCSLVLTTIILGIGCFGFKKKDLK